MGPEPLFDQVMTTPNRFTDTVTWLSVGSGVCGRSHAVSEGAPRVRTPHPPLEEHPMPRPNHLTYPTHPTRPVRPTRPARAARTSSGGS